MSPTPPEPTRKRQLPFLHFAPTDYFSSPRVRQLIHEGKFEVVLAYLHFIFSQWLNQGPIRVENAAGAIWMPGTEIGPIMEQLNQGPDPLVISRDGYLWNYRVALDLAAAVAGIEKAAANGRRGARVRYSKETGELFEPSPPMATPWPPHSDPIAPPCPPPLLPPYSPPSPSPSPSPSPQQTKQRASRVEPSALRSAADRYITAFNDVHKKKCKVTPVLLQCIEACLKAEPSYTPDDLVAAALMSYGDEWYADREPSYPIRFRRAGRQEGKSHLDDLLAQIAPGKKYAKELIAHIRTANMIGYFKEKTAR